MTEVTPGWEKLPESFIVDNKEGAHDVVETEWEGLVVLKDPLEGSFESAMGDELWAPNVGNEGEFERNPAKLNVVFIPVQLEVSVSRLS